jgi:hypothetical protein
MISFFVWYTISTADSSKWGERTRLVVLLSCCHPALCDRHAWSCHLRYVGHELDAIWSTAYVTPDLDPRLYVTAGSCVVSTCCCFYVANWLEQKNGHRDSESSIWLAPRFQFADVYTKFWRTFVDGWFVKKWSPFVSLIGLFIQSVSWMEINSCISSSAVYGFQRY